MIEKIIKFVQVLLPQLSNEGDRAALYTALALVGTAAILFFTITLIPFQQFATQYTPSLFRYIRNDRRIVGGFIVFLVLILFELSLMFFKPTYLNIILASMGVVLSFLLIGYLWRWSTKLLNPKEQVIPKIHRRGVSEVDHLFRKLEGRKKYSEEKIVELEEMMRQALNTCEKTEAKVEKFEVPRSYLSKVIREVRILKELCNGFIRTNQTEMFQASWQAIVGITKHYLMRRSGYISNLDYYLLDLSDDFKDIISIAGKEANLHNFRLIWIGIKEISISSLELEVIGSKEGHHELATPIVNVLKEGLTKDLLSGRTDSAFEATRSLGDIGVQMAMKGYIQSAAYLCADLARYVVVSNKYGQTAVNHLAKQYMAEIFFQALERRVLFVNYDFPYRQMIESYDKVLSLQDQQVTIGLTDSISWWDADMLKDRSISSLIRVALFPVSDDDNVIYYNLDVAKYLIKLMKKHYLEDSILQTSFTSQLYQIALWLIAFIDKDTALEFLVYRKSVTIPTQKNREKAVSILFDLLDWFFEMFLRSFNDSQNRVWERSELLNNLLSVYYMFLHFEGVHNLGLSVKLDNYMNRQVELIESKLPVMRLSDGEWGSLSFFTNYLRKQGLWPRLRRKIGAYLRVAGYRYVSEHDFHLLNHIKRPIVTFRQDVFAELDNQIFGNENLGVKPNLGTPSKFD